MRKLLLACLIGFAVLPDMVGAADLQQVPPLKAIAIPPRPLHLGLYPFTGSGFYYGLAFGGSVTHASVSGQDSPLLALGGSLGAGFGYRWADSPTTAFAVDFQGMWNNLGGDTSCNAGATNCSIGADFSAIARAKAIVPLSVLSSVLPSPLPPVPPLPIPGFSAGQNVYAFVGFKLDDVSAQVGVANGRAWQGSPGFGIGSENQAPSGLVLDVWAGYFTPTSGFTFGSPFAANADMGRQYMVGANLWF